MCFENLVALHIAIEQQCPQETAFKYLDRILNGNPKGYSNKPQFAWTTEDIKDIKRFRKQGLTYKEIADIYFTTDQAIYRVLKRDKKRAAGAAKIKN